MAVCAAHPDFPEDITMVSYEALL
ncbi:4'-phosphopantetheinyl transferase, partial [Bacillus inaquosorum]|nr:4'-phosphopantetheinyl transferase [Bacillus inaquosorum]